MILVILDGIFGILLKVNKKKPHHPYSHPLNIFFSIFKGEHRNSC